MINTFSELGYIERKKPGFKRIDLLKALTYSPRHEYTYKNDTKSVFEILINLKKNGKIELKKGKEIDLDNKENYFAFRVGSSQGINRINFTTNNLEYHLFQTLEHTCRKLEAMGKNYKSFYDYIKKTKEKFYKIKKNKEGKPFYYLNYIGLENPDYVKFIKTELENKKLTKTVIANAYKKLISEKILGIALGEFKYFDTFTILLDGKRIQKTEFREQYFDLIYDQRINRFFEEKECAIKDKVCHICGGKKARLTGKIDIPTKFYITDKISFFENLQKKNAYKSFTICEDCYKNLLIGISIIQKELSSKFNRINYYIIPKNTQKIHYKKEDFKLLKKKVLLRNPKNLRDFFEKYKRLIERMKNENIRFDLLFFAKSKNEFIVLKYVPDVAFKNVEKINREIIDANNIKLLSELGTVFDFNAIYYLLFPNKSSHSKVDVKAYRKELLDIVEKIYLLRKIKMNLLIRKFNFIFKKTLRKKGKFPYLKAIHMNLLLLIFKKLELLEGDVEMEGTSLTKIGNKYILDYFKAHEAVYGNNEHKKGLFLLGYLINQILRWQSKNNFLGKLNFDGVKPGNVTRLVADVVESLKNRTDKNGRSLFDLNSKEIAWMFDRLEGIEKSKLSRDEVLFYILSGIAFSRYLKMKYSKGGDSE